MQVKYWLGIKFLNVLFVKAPNVTLINNFDVAEVEVVIRKHKFYWTKQLVDLELTRV